MRAIKKPSKQMDMLHGPMMKNLLLFALPLALSGILQQLFTSADMAVIFYYEGSAAQSAVNSNGALVNLIINLFSGMSVGATVLVAELIGKKRTDDIHSVVLTSMVIALASGVVILGIGIGLAKPLLMLMNTPTEALPLAVTYLQIYFIGMPFLMVFNFGAALLRGMGDTKMSLYILLITGGFNIGLNFLFVGACHMSVAGVALATVLSNIACAVLALWFLMRNKTLRMKRGSKVRGEYIKRICVIGLPAGLQGVVFSISNVCIQTAINSFGFQAVAGSGDAVNFEYYIYYFINGFAQATVTFIGQNYAAGEYAQCKRLFKLNLLTSLAVAAVMSFVFVIGAKLFIRIYTTDEVAIEFAVMRMWCVLSTTLLTCFFEIPGGALRGMGHSLLPAVLTVIGSCVLRIIWIYTVFVYVSEFWMLMIIYPISWVITGIAMLISYFVIASKAFKGPPVMVTETPSGEMSIDGAVMSDGLQLETVTAAECAATSAEGLANALEAADTSETAEVANSSEVENDEGKETTGGGPSDGDKLI